MIWHKCTFDIPSQHDFSLISIHFLSTTVWRWWSVVLDQRLPISRKLFGSGTQVPPPKDQRLTAPWYTIIASCMLYTWNPNDPCFDCKRPVFGGFNHQNRGQTGSRYIRYFSWTLPTSWFSWTFSYLRTAVSAVSHSCDTLQNLPSSGKTHTFTSERVFACDAQMGTLEGGHFCWVNGKSRVFPSFNPEDPRLQIPCQAQGLGRNSRRKKICVWHVDFLPNEQKALTDRSTTLNKMWEIYGNMGNSNRKKRLHDFEKKTSDLPQWRTSWTSESTSNKSWNHCVKRINHQQS